MRDWRYVRLAHDDLDGLGVDVRVDGSYHTRLAVFALRTVEPDRLVIGNADGVGQKLRRVSGRCGWHEA